MPEGRRYDIATDRFSGPLVTVKVDGFVVQIQAASGINADGKWMDEAREALRNKQN